MDTPFMDIVKSETLRGFTELTLFYMSDLDDSSLSLLLYFFRSVFILYTTHNALPKLFVCVLVIESSAKVLLKLTPRCLYMWEATCWFGVPFFVT